MWIGQIGFLFLHFELILLNAAVIVCNTFLTNDYYWLLAQWWYLHLVRNTLEIIHHSAVVPSVPLLWHGAPNHHTNKNKTTALQVYSTLPEFPLFSSWRIGNCLSIWSHLLRERWEPLGDLLPPIPTLNTEWQAFWQRLVQPGLNLKPTRVKVDTRPLDHWALDTILYAFYI